MSVKDIVQGFVPGEKRPYVYGLFYPASMGGSCFYVGKGTGYRINTHEREAEKKMARNPYKCNVIRKIQAIGELVGKVVFSYFDTDEEAFLYEIALILLFGGLLTNLTDGGEGRRGCALSEDHRRKLIEARKGKKVSEETRRKMSEAQKGRILSEETRRKISETGKGRHHSEETRRKISEKQMSQSEETRRKNSEAQKGKEFSEETRRKISEACKGRILSEETRRKIGAFQKGTKRGPLPEETRHKIREAHRARWQSRKEQAS